MSEPTAGTQATPETPKRRTPSISVALLPLVAMALLIGIGYGVYGMKAQVLLVAAALITGGIGMALGFTWGEMQDGIVDAIHKAMPAVLIMLCVGLLIASWIAAGTIPMIMYYGLKLISPSFFLPTTCLVCTITALATGTSWGTIGTLGVAFIGIAGVQGIPLGPAAGAIVAGAYMGDKMSPFSDIPNLAPIASGSNLFDNLKHMMWSALPAWVVGMGIYFFVGLGYGAAAPQSSTIESVIATLDRSFRFNILLLLPLAIVFYFAFAKKPVIPGMLLSVVVAGVLAVVFQKIGLVELAAALNSGYKPATGTDVVDQLLARGGLMSMTETQLIAFAAFAFGGIMQRVGLLKVLLDRIAGLARYVWSLVLTTVIASILTGMVTCSSYLSMIIPGELLAPMYREKNLAAKNLARIITEAGGIMVPLIPWSMAGVYITATIGVPVTSYMGWAFMNYVSVLVLILYGFTGFTMAPRVHDDETQIGS
jgi:NhaC family Na+:H+ antiporter